MDVDEHDLDYLAQAHWHHFRYRYGEMVGLDRARKEVILAPTFDEEGREITPRRSFRYDTLVIAIGSVVNDFGTPGVKEHAIALDQTQQAARFNRRLVNACIRAHAQEGPVRPGQLRCRDHRRRRHRHRARGRAAPHHPGRGRLRPRPGGSGEGHPHHPDRSRGPHPAGPAAAHLGGGPQACSGTSESRSAPGRGSARCGRTACSSPMAASSPRSSSSGRRG